MAEWAYGLSQGIAGAAGSAVTSVDAKMKEELDNRAANRDLDIKIRLMAANQQLQYQADDRKRALALKQGKDIGTAATGLLNSDVATKINSTLGSEIDPNNPESRATIEAIRNNPAAAARYGVEPDSDLVKGKARAEAARGIGDLSAAAEEDKNVRNLVQDQRNVKNDETTNRRLDITETFQKNMQERQQTLAEATLKYQRRMADSADSRATAAESREQRAATAKALDGVNSDIKALEKESADMMLDDGRRKAAQQQLQDARKEAADYRKRLAGAGVPGAAQDTPAPLPVPKAGDVIQGMKFKGGDPRDKTNWEAPAAAPKAAPAPTKSGGLLATADDGDLAKATPAQLWKAVESPDPLQKKFATAELRRRGLLAAEPSESTNARQYFDAGT